MAAREIASLLDGIAHLATIDDPPPSAGTVTFTDTAGVKRVIDVLTDVYGLASGEVARTAIPFVLQHPDTGEDVPLLVMHPERCMESRIKNVGGLGRKSARSLDQLDAAIACCREFLREIIEEPDGFGREPAAAVRDILALNKRIYRFARSDREARTVAVEHEREALDASLLEHPLLPPDVGRVCAPRWRADISRRRMRDRDHAGRSGRSGEPDTIPPVRCADRTPAGRAGG